MVKKRTGIHRKYSETFPELWKISEPVCDVRWKRIHAVSRDPEFGYAFIEKYQDRLYFGTDICSPENDMELSFWLDDAVNNGHISQAAYEKVSRTNALKLLER